MPDPSAPLSHKLDVAPETLNQAHRLNARTRRMIVLALSKGQSLSAAARSAKLSPRTLQRWLEAGRRQRAGPYWQLVCQVEAARSFLRQQLDDAEYCIAFDKAAPPGTRLRAIEAIRRRVFGGSHPHPQVTQLDVYHYLQPVPTQGVRVDAHVIDAEQGDPEDEKVKDAAPRSLVSSEDLRTLDTEALAKLVDAMRDARAELTDDGGEAAVIDSEDV